MVNGINSLSEYVDAVSDIFDYVVDDGMIYNRSVPRHLMLKMLNCYRSAVATADLGNAREFERDYSDLLISLDRLDSLTSTAQLTRSSSPVEGAYGPILIGIGVFDLLHDMKKLHDAANSGNQAAYNKQLGEFGSGLFNAAVAAALIAATCGPAGMPLMVGIPLIFGGYEIGKRAFQLFDFLFPYPDSLPIDPLVVDLNGDGVQLISVTQSNVNFDFDGDGFRERAGWVSAQDGLLDAETLKHYYAQHAAGGIDASATGLKEMYDINKGVGS